MFTASLCLTAAFTISITRYRLMQLDQLLSSGVVYFLISFLAGLVYYGIVGVRRHGAGRQPLQRVAVAQAACWRQRHGLLLCWCLDLLRGRFTAVLDRHFRREKNQLDRTLQRMSQAIEQLVDPPTLAPPAANLGGIARRSAAPSTCDRATAPVSSDRRARPRAGVDRAVVRLSAGRDVLTHGAWRCRCSSRSTAAGPRQLHFLGGATAHGLLHEGAIARASCSRPSGRAARLDRREDRRYTPEDLKLLTAFAQITVLALVSAEGHRTIETLNRELQGKVEKIAEQQRRILALQSQLSANRHPPGRRQSRTAKRQNADAAAARRTAAWSAPVRRCGS